MCGITGGVSKRNIAGILIEGLRRLEYRGYDSAGIAVIREDRIERIRRCGKVQKLAEMVDSSHLSGHIGVAHTRWATHGKPSENNAHPHLSSGADLAIVHNGIIENYEVLKKHLLSKGFVFESETDTEVVIHLVQEKYQQTQNIFEAVKLASLELEGAYALAVMSLHEPDHLVVVRKGCPLVIGVGVNENFVASDILALLPVTQSFIVLEEGDIASIYEKDIFIRDRSGKVVERAIRQAHVTLQSAEKGSFRHFMQKEIFEQPFAVSSALEGRCLERTIPDAIFGEKAQEVFDKTKAVYIVACGTSYHAGLVGKYWLESLAGIPTQVEIASEFRYRRPVLLPGTLLVLISQSGETADSLAALQGVDRANLAGTLSICNVPESSIVLQTDCALLTHAGPEIGVASTKAFTTQLTALLLLVASLGNRFGMNAELVHELVQHLRSLPERLENALLIDESVKSLIPLFRSAGNALFLGRDKQVPIAMEGALKLKEISYIHAEAYPAGELKHGTLALVDENLPIVVLAPNDSLSSKLRSNIEEIAARGGKIIVFAEEGVVFSPHLPLHVVYVPAMPNVLSPILMTIPLQLLAYHVAVDKGTDVDQPRNLAKSVTVE